MTDAPDARNNDDIAESPYFKFHEAFVIEPAESLELDRARNRLLTVHPHHGMAANYAIQAEDLRVSGCVQTWALTATSLEVGVDHVVFLTHPYGKLVKAGRDGRVLDRYEIWHRYLTSLVLMGDLLFVTDRRNDVVMQFDMRKPMSEDSSLLIGRGYLYRPLGTSVLHLEYLLVVQNNGRVIVFDLITGFRLTSFANEIPMIGEVSIQAEDTHSCVLLGKEMEKCLDVFCLTGYKSREVHGCQVPRFCHALHLTLNFSPYSTVYSPEMQLVYILERRAKAKSQVHAFRLVLHLLSYI